MALIGVAIGSRRRPVLLLDGVELEDAEHAADGGLISVGGCHPPIHNRLPCALMGMGII